MCIPGENGFTCRRRVIRCPVSGGDRFTHYLLAACLNSFTYGQVDQSSSYAPLLMLSTKKGPFFAKKERPAGGNARLDRSSEVVRRIIYPAETFPDGASPQYMGAIRHVHKLAPAPPPKTSRLLRLSSTTRPHIRDHTCVRAAAKLENRVGRGTRCNRCPKTVATYQEKNHTRHHQQQPLSRRRKASPSRPIYD